MPSRRTWLASSALPLGVEPFSSIQDSLMTSNRDRLGLAMFCNFPRGGFMRHRGAWGYLNECRTCVEVCKHHVIIFFV